MTNWAVMQSDLFKAGVSENGISYWLTSYAFSDMGLWFDKEVIGENPLEKRELQRTKSTSPCKQCDCTIHEIF